MKRNIKILFTLVGVCIYYFFFFYYSSSNHLVITWNPFTGEMKREKQNGFHLFSPPWEFASKIDNRPHRVCITSASRNTNCRLVRIDPDKWEDLIKIEGFHYFWWYNRFSFNSGQDTYRGVDNLLLGHAYGSTRCPCVEIMQEIGDEN